jgi:hypothetical protein
VGIVASVIKSRGINNETLVLDGAWLEKLRGNDAVARVPAADYRGLEVKDVNRRKKLFGGEREELLQLTIDVGTFIGFTAPGEKGDQVDELHAELERTRTE